MPKEFKMPWTLGHIGDIVQEQIGHRGNNTRIFSEPGVI